jgi:hypothetical protein|tara:strand:- start:218 stop:361 length:144 start_codon:yes stop_codon:yes gene_type:complete
VPNLLIAYIIINNKKPVAILYKNSTWAGGSTFVDIKKGSLQLPFLLI